MRSSLSGVRVGQLVAISAALTIALAARVPAAGAAVPGTMVIEGLLTSTGGGAAADGSYDMTFAIYNVQSGGSPAWTEGAKKVAVKGGQFTHVLGATKPLSAALLGQLTKGWLGLKVGADPELPRQPLHAVAYAVLAGAANKLTCSGCLSSANFGKGSIPAAAVGFNYAGSKTKGGPANSAIDLACTGCVSVSEMKFDKDVDLGGNALKAGKLTAATVAAATVQATSFIGDGSKLTGIKIPSGSCKKTGEVVKGINADGTLQCIKALDPTSLPADGIDEISNNLIYNQFVDQTCGPSIDIKDHDPIGTASVLTFPDIGLAQKLEVSVNVTNSKMDTVKLVLFDPNNVKYELISLNKELKGKKSLVTVFPTQKKTVKGDLTTWVGKNPKGKWRLQVIDDDFLNNAVDGKLKSWCVKIQTLSNKKVQIKGNLIVDGDITSPGGLNVNGSMKIGDSKAPCNKANKGMMRWVAGKGLLACDGTNWVAALAKPVILQGGCNSSPSYNGWYYRCMNLVSINTAQDYLYFDGNSKSYSTNSAYGRVYAKIPGYYRVTASNYGHSRDMQVRIYRSGTDIGGAVSYHDNNRPRTVVADKVVYLSKGQYIQVRVYTNVTSKHWYGCNNAGYSCQNWTTLEYLGNNL